jgi:prepilin-type N-terminal cleavage/methylation domain-containing protein
MQTENRKTIMLHNKRSVLHISEDTNTRAAFSLIEVLVVISVITILCGLIFPVMSRAKAIANQAACRSRLRQWGLAFQIYADENEGFYPHIDGRDRTSSKPQTYTEEADYYFGWIDVLPPTLGEKSWCDYDYGQKPGAETIFQCPSARLAPDESYKYRPQRTGYFSYAMNSCLELDENCWSPYGSGGTDWQMPSFLNILSVKNTSRLILLYDQLLDPERGYGGMISNPTAGKYCGSYPKAFSARHSKPGGLLGGSILYCDYHIEWKKSVWKVDWPRDLEVPPLGDLDWYPN